MNLQIVFNSPKNPYLNQATQKILAKIFLSKKIPKTKISTPPPPPKSLYHPCYLKSGVQSVPPPWPFTATFYICDSVHHAGKVLKTLNFHYMFKVDDWVYFKARQCLKLLEIYKETFYAFRWTKKIVEFMKMDKISDCPVSSSGCLVTP